MFIRAARAGASGSIVSSSSFAWQLAAPAILTGSRDHVTNRNATRPSKRARAHGRTPPARRRSRHRTTTKCKFTSASRRGLLTYPRWKGARIQLVLPSSPPPAFSSSSYRDHHIIIGWGHRAARARLRPCTCSSCLWAPALLFSSAHADQRPTRLRARISSVYMGRLREGTDPGHNACPVYVAVMYEPPGATCPGARLAAAAYKNGLQRGP